MYIRQYIGSSTALCRGWVGISTCVSPTMMDIIGTNLQLYGTDAARRASPTPSTPAMAGSSGSSATAAAAAALTATGASTTLARFSVSQFSNIPRQ